MQSIRLLAPLARISLCLALLSAPVLSASIRGISLSTLDGAIYPVHVTPGTETQIDLSRIGQQIATVSWGDPNVIAVEIVKIKRTGTNGQSYYDTKALRIVPLVARGSTNLNVWTEQSRLSFWVSVGAAKNPVLVWEVGPMPRSRPEQAAGSGNSQQIQAYVDQLAGAARAQQALAAAGATEAGATFEAPQVASPAPPQPTANPAPAALKPQPIAPSDQTNADPAVLKLHLQTGVVSRSAAASFSPLEILAPISIPMKDGTSKSAANLLLFDLRHIWRVQGGQLRKRYSILIDTLIETRNLQKALSKSTLKLNEVQYLLKLAEKDAAA